MKSESLLRKTAWTAIGAVANAFASGIVTVASARLLGPAGSGLVAYAVWFVGVVMGTTGLGIHQALPRFVAEQSGRDSTKAEPLARWLFRFSCGVIALGVVVTWFGWLAVRGSDEGGAFRIAVCMVFILQATSMMYLSLLSGLQRFREAARYSAIAGMLLVVCVTIGLSIRGPIGGVLGYGAGVVVTFIGAMLFAFSTDSLPPDTAVAKRMARYAFSQWISGLLAILVWMKGEVFFLEHYWGTGEVGLYNSGLTLAQIAQQGPLLLSGALVPHFTEMVGANRMSALRETYATSSRLMALLVFPSCLWLTGLTPVLLPLLFGNQFQPAVPSAMVITAASAIGVVGSTSASVVNALERSRYLALTSTFLASVALGTYAVAVPRWGLWGAACARTIVQALAAVVGYAYMQWVLKIPTPFGIMGRMLLAALASSVVGGVAASAIGGHAGVACGLALMMVTYCTILRITRAIAHEDARRINSAIGRLPPLLGRPVAVLSGLISPQD